MTNTDTLDRDIVAIAELEAQPFILDRKAFDAFLTKVRAEVALAGDDVTTDKGRKAIASAAYKVAKCKTALDNAGKALTDEWRQKTNEVNEARRHVRETLDALKDEVRMPLTEWEQAEKARQERAASIMDELKSVRDNPAPFGATAEAVTDRLSEVQAQALDADTFGDQLGFAEKVKAEAVEALTAAAERIRREEAERAELEALRREKAEREAREAEEAEAKARAEQEAAHAAEAEERRKREAAEAEARAKRMAEEAAEKARVEERQRIEREQREAAAREEAAAKEAERQARNKKHRREVETAAAGALAAHVEGLSDDQAAAVITAIAAGYVPRVAVQY